MEKIIVPVDFSKDSQKAIEYAIIFANKWKCDLDLIYVQPDSFAYFPESFGAELQLLEKNETIAYEKLEKLTKMYQSKLTFDQNLQFRVRKGSIFKEVVEYAEEYQKSLIVMSTHGESGFERLFMGSNAYKILSSTTQPVITFKKGFIPHDINKIVMPVDASIDTRQKAGIVAEIASLFNSKVYLVEVANSDLERKTVAAYSHQIKELFDDAGVNYKIEKLPNGNITDQTLEFANKINADLITIMTEQEESMTNILLGTYAHQMLNKSEIPMLTITPKEFYKPNEFFKTQG